MDSEPDSLKDVKWQDVKTRITTEVYKYVLDIQQKKAGAENKKEESLQEIISKKKHKK